ncbi:hypothetical protein ACFLQ2_03365 [archaeon]
MAEAKTYTEKEGEKTYLTEPLDSAAGIRDAVAKSHIMDLVYSQSKVREGLSEKPWEAHDSILNEMKDIISVEPGVASSHLLGEALNRSKAKLYSYRDLLSEPEVNEEELKPEMRVVFQELQERKIQVKDIEKEIEKVDNIRGAHEQGVSVLSKLGSTKEVQEVLDQRLLRLAEGIQKDTSRDRTMLEMGFRNTLSKLHEKNLFNHMFERAHRLDHALLAVGGSSYVDTPIIKVGGYEKGSYAFIDNPKDERIGKEAFHQPTMEHLRRMNSAKKK